MKNINENREIQEMSIENPLKEIDLTDRRAPPEDYSQLMRERTYLLRNIKDYNIQKRIFEVPKRKQNEYYLPYEDTKKLQQHKDQIRDDFRESLKLQIEEKRRLDEERKEIEQEIENAFERKRLEDIVKMREEFEEDHRIEPPPLSKFFGDRGPSSDRSHLKFEPLPPPPPKKEIVIPVREQQKNKLLRSFLSPVLSSSDPDSLDMLIKSSRQSSGDFFDSTADFLIDNNLSSEYAKRTALLDGWSSVCNSQQFEGSLSKINALAQHLREHPSVDIIELVRDQRLDQEPIFPGGLKGVRS